MCINKFKRHHYIKALALSVTISRMKSNFMLVCTTCWLYFCPIKVASLSCDIHEFPQHTHTHKLQGLHLLFSLLTSSAPTTGTELTGHGGIKKQNTKRQSLDTDQDECKMDASFCLVVIFPAPLQVQTV